MKWQQTNEQERKSVSKRCLIGWTGAFWFQFGYLYIKKNESYKVWMYITHVRYFRIQPDFSYSFETWRCLDRARGKGTNALKCDDMKGYLPMQPDFFHCCSQGLHWVLSTGCQSPNIHEFSTKMERSYYRTSHTWTIRVSSSRPAPLRRHNLVSFRFPSLEGQSPPYECAQIEHKPISTVWSLDFETESRLTFPL